MTKLQGVGIVEFACNKQNNYPRRRRINFRALIPRLVVILPIFMLIFGIMLGAGIKTAKADSETITSPGLSITIDPKSPLVFDLQPGVFNSATQGLTVSTTSVGGYTMTMETAGYGSVLTTDLVNVGDPTDTTKRIKSITSPQGDMNFDNAYGYYFTNNATPPATITWHPVPAINNGVPTQAPLAETNGINSAPDEYTLAFGALVDTSIPAGTYQNTFTISIVAKVSPYTIIFNGNGGQTAGNETSYTQPIGVGIPETLKPNEFTRTDYVFTGWNTEDDGSGTTYAADYNTANGEVENASAGATVNLYAQWVKYCAPGKICYNDNGANSTTKMSDQSASSNTATMLWPSNFKREGYGFAGWAETDQITNTTKIYGPMETITTPDLSANGLNLYAVWVKSAGSLQNWGGCATLPAATYDNTNGTLVANISNVTALTDTRDNNTYAVAKLTDGNCWFIENLRLGGAAAITLTPQDTSIDTNFTLPASASNPNVTVTTPQQNSYNTIATVATMTGLDQNIYSYGNYYKWAAAIASSSAYNASNTVINTSICPTSWQLPVNNSATIIDKSFRYLDVSIGGTGEDRIDDNNVFKLRYTSFPNNFVYSGRKNASSTVTAYRGEHIRYWASTPENADDAYGINIINNNTTSEMAPNGAMHKYFGHAVRCISRDSYTIEFNSNGGSGTMNDQAFFIDTSNTLNSNTFTAPNGKSFKEWNTKADGTGTSYTDGQTFASGTNLAAKGETIELFAIWQNDITSIGNMQDMTSELCANTQVGVETTLKDLRDNKTYFVAKLADGKCWMTQNLDLDLSASVTLTSEKSDFPASKTWTPENDIQTATGVTWEQYGGDGARSYDIGKKYFEGGKGSGTYSGYNYTPQDTGDEHYSLGNYYNLVAATAGTGVNGVNSGNVTDSICPKGWRLPTSTSSGDFAALMSAYGITDNAAGSTKASEAPLYFVRSGVYEHDTGRMAYLGEYATYRSSTIRDKDYGYLLYLTPSGANPSEYNTRNYGRPIRCVARDTYTINFDANGGTGTMPSQLGYRDQATELNANTFTNGNEEFHGWNTSADGNGTSYSDKEAVTNLVNVNNSITLYAQWGCPSNHICYFDNGANSATKMSDHPVSTDGAYDLWPSNFKRDGYGFAGWSRDKNAVTHATDNDPTNDPVIYGPMQNINVGDISLSGLNLYAVWIEAKEDLQGWTGCSKLTKAEYTNGTLVANLSSVTALKDSRDGNAYAVARLADGNCWMIENLRLSNTTLDGQTVQITNENTDKPNATLVANGLPASTNSFATTVNTTNVNKAYINTNNTANTVLEMGANVGNVYSYGNYYNWTLATGQNGLWANASGSVDGSICPVGWSLPIGGVATTTNKSFSHLDVVMDGTGNSQTSTNAAIAIVKWVAFPNNFIYSGNLNGTSINNGPNNGGNYWSATAYNNSNAYRIRFDKTPQINPGSDYNYKTVGFSVRCVARDSYKVSYDSNGGSGAMDDVSVSVGNSVTLPDSTFTAPAGKSFIGWNTKADGSGTSYNAGDNVTEADIQAATGSAYDSQTNNTLRLYAQYGVTIENIGTMQEMTAALCAATPVKTETRLRDTRDNKVYYVAKLADGKCWMTQNLDLDLSTVTALTDADTDLNNKASWTPDNDTQTTDGGAWAITIAHSYDHGDAYLENGTGSGTESGNSNYPVLDTGDSHYHLGNLYNWAAATAGSGASTAAAGSAPDSICPKGWRLPTGGNSGELNALTTAYGVTNNAAGDERMRSAPLYFVHSGYYHGTNYYITGRGVSGRWHSSNSYNSTNQWMMMVASRITFAQPAYNQTEKRHGVSVRCVARENYTVKFDANGGSGTMADQTVSIGVATKLSANAFAAPSGKIFVGWNTAMDGGGTSYANEEEVTDLTTVGGAVTLYAQWATPYTITYDLDGGTNNPGNPSSYHTKTETFELLAPTRAGWAFTGWTGSNGTTPQKTVEIPKGTTGDLYYTANWGPIYYLVNNGSAQVAFTGASSCSVGGTICEYQANTWTGGTGRYIYTTNIDVTGYSTLYYEINLNPSSGSNGLQSSELMVSSSNGLTSGIEARKQVKSNYTSYTPGTIDVSALQGVKTIGFSMYANTSFGRTTKLGIINLWLE